MSDTPETPIPDSADTSVTETNPTTAPPPPPDAATTTTVTSSRRGIWKYLGAGAIGLVVGLIVAGGVAWGLSDDHDGRGGHKGDRPAMTQQMPGRRGQQDQYGSQNQGPQTQQTPNGQQAQPSGPMGGASGGGRTRAS